ncbi:hypothetical protein AMTRI_Chr02g265850 [Amborella trichopoda]
MGASRAQINKAHKSRFASKSSRQVHKTSGLDRRGISKTNQQNVLKGARATRIQRNKMLRDKKRAAILKEKRASTGFASPPRVIVLFGLSSSVDVKSLSDGLLTLLSSEYEENGALEFDNRVGAMTISSPTFKFRATIMEAPHGDLTSCIEMAKVADLIAFVASASSSSEGRSNSNSYIDSFGSQCLTIFRALGLPSSAVLILDLPTDQKKRSETKKTCTSSLSSQFPEDCKFFPADSKEELRKFLWLLKDQRLTTPHWRSMRPYVMAHEVEFIADDSSPGKATLHLSGYVRAHNLSVNQLVHVSGAGDFQLSQIDVVKDPFTQSEYKYHANSMDLDNASGPKVVLSLFPDASKQEPLLVENIPDPLAGEQTWPTEEDLAVADEKRERMVRKKTFLPKGTSDYQAAWIVADEIDDDDSVESEEEENNHMVLDEADNEGGGDHFDRLAPDEDHIYGSFSMRGFDEETEVGTTMTEDENLTKDDIEAEMKRLKEAHADDEQFPDEVDTPVDIEARKRFAKYRGLKSFRTSSWDPKESLPVEYSRIFTFSNFVKTQKQVFRKAKEMDEGASDECVPVGSYVRLHIKQVPVVVACDLQTMSKTRPIVSSGLFQHESKMSVLHFSIKKHASYDDPIKSKEALTFHVGFRQFSARPIFSSDNLNSDKHKMERFLHPGQFSVASIYAPISFPPLPLIALKERKGEASFGPSVAAIGSLRSIDPDRILLKKIILTGYPQRVSKSKAIVRFMFHNPEDVRWFKPVDVWTKCGRRGRVKEPVGTHGAMKCIFDGVVQQHDTVCMSLYKRVYPVWPELQGI